MNHRDGLEPATSLARFTGLGLLAPAAYFCLLRWEPGPGGAGAAIAGVLALGAAWRGQPERSLPLAFLAGALAAGLCAAALLPGLGVRGAAAVGTLALVCGLAGAERGRALSLMDVLWLALISGIWVAWTRCCSLLLGHSFYGFALSLSALLAGAGLAVWAKKRLPADREKEKLRGECALFAAGLAGILGLRFLRFAGINAGAGEYLQQPFLGRWDLFFLGAPIYAACAAWGFAAAWAFFSEKGGRPAARAAGALAPLGPAASYGLVDLAGPAAAAVSLSAAAMTAGLFLLARRAPASVLVKICAAAFAIGLWAGAATLEPFKDVWTNRLNAAYPGGNFLAWAEDASESAGVYRFSSGAKILIKNGIAHPERADFARHAVHLPLLARPGTRALLVGVYSPAAVRSALAHEGLRVDAVDPNSRYPELLEALADKRGAAKDERLTIVRQGMRRYLRAPGPVYGSIFIALEAPLGAPENAFKITAESLALLKSRLDGPGLLAVQAPDAAGAARRRLIQTVQRAFAHVKKCPLPGAFLLLASDAPVSVDAASLGARLTPEIWIDDGKLMEYARRPGCLDLDAFKDAARSETDDRPLNAFPLPEILAATRPPEL